MSPSRHSNAGFTLMEVLMAVWLLSVGMLGVAAYVAKSIQMTPVNEHTAHAMLITSQTVEPLERLLSQDRSNFQTTVSGWQRAPRLLDDGYEVSITARDSDGNDIAATDPSSWRPPLLVTLRIGFPPSSIAGLAHGELTTTRVFVP